MSDETKVDTNTAEFKRGFAAGLDSAEVTAGNLLDQEPNRQAEQNGPEGISIEEPLFMRATPEGHKGDGQDEKDEVAE